VDHDARCGIARISNAWSNPMTSLIPVVHVIVSAAVLNVLVDAADAQTLQPTVLPAPIGHAQPHSSAFVPRSQANEEEQQRLSSFDAEQHKRDEKLDKKLENCGC
jgi:Cu2+-containing amine oxidase